MNSDLADTDYRGPGSVYTHAQLEEQVRSLSRRVEILEAGGAGEQQPKPRIPWKRGMKLQGRGMRSGVVLTCVDYGNSPLLVHPDGEAFRAIAYAGVDYWGEAKPSFDPELWGVVE